MMQGAGALGMVAAVAVGVAALTAGGTSGSGAPTGSRRPAPPPRARSACRRTVGDSPDGVTVDAHAER